MRENGKIKRIEELASLLEPLRGNKRIVLCHGVFDLLHIGHIRHFAKAKEQGDVLLVTITPDRHVNKGPHRPVFREDLRAEAVAALDCVDYVAINKWPLATETIKLLRPDLYVKGADYREADKDITGGIALEEAAIKSVGGRLVYTTEITFSSSSLVNRYLPVFPPGVRDYLSSFSTRYPPNYIFEILNGAKPLKVLVVGEAIIDEYQYCTTIGKSSKEPILCLKKLSVERFAGGILAVANNVANFSENVGLLTLLGADNSERAFIDARLNNKIDKTFLSKRASPTIVKRRFVDGYSFAKLLEVYEINDDPLDSYDEESLLEALSRKVPEYDVVMVVDFGHGMLTSAAIDLVCSSGKFLALNVQSNAGNLGYHTVSKYPRADYVCVAENEMRLESRDRRGDLRDMVSGVSRKLGCSRVIVTRGRYGCLCFDREQGFFEVPAFAGQVVDRIGAGDAFLSVSALCVAQSAPIEAVGFIGNAVGAQAVATVGHREPVDRLSLFRQIESLLK